jgi:hypothetical protein
LSWIETNPTTLSSNQKVRKKKKPKKTKGGLKPESISKEVLNYFS